MLISCLLLKDQSDDEVLKEGQSVSTREQNEEEKDGEEEEVNPSEGKKVHYSGMSHILTGLR